MLVPAAEYHRLTSYLPPNRFGDKDDPRIVHGYRPMELRRKPPAIKAYPGRPSEPVPPELEDVLFLSAGVVRTKHHPALGQMVFRAAGSAGNLSPLEVYVVAGGRVLHYQPLEHRLTAIGTSGGGDGVSIVVTGVPWRTGWKYTERGFRHLYWDAGTMLAQLLAVAGGRARLELGFVDHEVTALVGAEGVHEFPLAVVHLGQNVLQGEAAAGFVADAPLEFPLVTAAQRAGDLGDEAEVERWRAAFGPAITCAGSDGTVFGLPLADVIRSRGSTRQFDPTKIGPAALLTDAFAYATDGLTLLDHYVLVHSVHGVAPGAYRWDGRFERIDVPVDDTRALGQGLTLDQSLGGDGCYTAFHTADLDAMLTGPLGDRGYRAAQLEAGIAEGRLHLAAYALGFGATGLTFFDDAVRQTFSTTTWPMLVTAVGKPTYRSKPGGEPGKPTALSNF